MSGPPAPGTLIIEAADVAVLAWASAEAIRSLRTAGRAVPSELAKLHVLLRSASANARTSAPTADEVPASVGRDELTVQEAAVAIDRSEQRVRQLVAEGRMPARKAGRQWLIDRDALRAHANTAEVA